MGFKNSDELYNQLSYGGTIQTKLVNLLLSYDADAKAAVEAEKERSLLENLNEISEKAQKRNQQKKKQEDNSGVIVEGLVNLMIRMSGCCTPVPGDEIIGFITKGRGISVHRKDCDNLKNLPEKDKGRCISVSWDPELLDKSFNAEITLTAKDQKGLFSNISKVCEDMDVNILGLNARADKNENVNITLTLSIKDRSQIEKMCRSFKSIPGILEAYRSRA